MSRFALTKTLSAVSLSLVIGICLVGFQGCSGNDPTGPGEDTPAGPTVSILAPTDGATVSGAVTISASATDADTVRFFVEGNEIGFDALDPYEAVWNTGTIANGDCVLLVRAIRGQQSAEDQVTVVVDNAAGTVIVSVSPATASVALGETQQFLAEVTGTANTAVTWAVDNGAAWGTIAAGGLYTAPGALPDPATATVRATSVADPARSATATVTLSDPEIPPPVTVSVQPEQATLALGETQQFSAQVTGTTNTTVTWSVDGGAVAGSITADGLFTAPATLPAPATATVRATSVTDPSKSDTAIVTLTGGSTSQEEQAAILQLFSGAYDIGELGLEAVAIAAEAVFGASEFAGGVLTLHGTLTQQAQGSDIWTYAPSPAGELLVVYAGGPTIKFVFSTFTGYLEGTWEDFVDAHTVDFTMYIAGQADLRIQSDKHFTKAGISGAKTWNAEFVRIVTGTVVSDQDVLSLDVTHSGEEIDCYIEPSFAHYEYDESFVGTVTSTAAAITLNQQFWASISHNSSQFLHVKDTVLQSNSSATIGGSTYTWDDVYVKWHSGSILDDPGYFSVVIEPYNWALRGRLLKDGVVYGTLQYDRPLVDESHGPELVLHLGTGEDIWVHTLIQFP
ncbi:MAG: Ig-like domain-containing protein [Candidatus Eisenbacteria sp.]|nr:Ig-like domain-containing protein [Candidatus Eisenbacteria bacterium]